MKIFIHRYSLNAKSLLNSQEKSLLHLNGKIANLQGEGLSSGGASEREGLIFKIRFPDLSEGYSSLHFHPSLGDMSLDEFLKEVKQNGKAYIFKNFSEVILNASVDAKGHWKGVMSHSSFAPTHYTSRDTLLSADELSRISKKGFQRIKIKVGIDDHSLKNITDHYLALPLAKELNWILDFNFSGKISEILSDLDLTWGKAVYLEDPVAYSKEDWTALTAGGFKILADRVSPEVIFKDQVDVEALVVKPTRTDMLEVIDGSGSYKILVTSNMGEDIDIMTSCYWANYLYQNHASRFFGAGLWTQDFYQHTPYLSLAETLQESYLGRSDFKHADLVHWGKNEFLQQLQWDEV